MVNWYTYCATLGPIGHMIAPGTVATIITLPFVYLLHDLICDEQQQFIFLVLTAVVSTFIVHKMLAITKRHDDPCEVVLDEFVGCLMVYWGISLSLPTVLIGFILFRFFDISKLCGIRYLEKIEGAPGIILDDIGAAIISNCILRLLF